MHAQYNEGLNYNNNNNDNIIIKELAKRRLSMKNIFQDDVLQRYQKKKKIKTVINMWKHNYATSEKYETF